MTADVNDSTVQRIPPPLLLLVLNRLREFYREPMAVFWVYGFPLMMALAWRLAFRNRPVEEIRIDVVESSSAVAVVKKLAVDPRLRPTIHDAETARLRYRDAKTDLVVTTLPSASDGRARYEFEFD